MRKQKSEPKGNNEFQETLINQKPIYSLRNIEPW